MRWRTCCRHGRCGSTSPESVNDNAMRHGQRSMSELTRAKQLALGKRASNSPIIVPATGLWYLCMTLPRIRMPSWQRSTVRELRTASLA